MGKMASIARGGGKPGWSMPGRPANGETIKKIVSAAHKGSDQNMVPVARSGDDSKPKENSGRGE